ncbi:DotI/IcmL/TraM family protein [uncultured Legionella sp.]|uniref:DotI/IcmL/TraM family protein n=1 Tax=uncultured Legionella sp. TaxID=210934 RepID=UPI0026242666|nr:DotI/IcmL/TraM family protein [uncultured Legionella sp.]
MKKSMLWGALLTLICTQLHAEATQPAGQVQTQDTTNSVTTTTTPTPAADQNTPTNQINPQNQNVQPQTTQPVPTTNQQPSNGQVQPTQTAPVEQQAPPVINCDYKIPAETKIIDQSLVLTWSEKAVTQAFDFEPASLDAQLQKLQSCFTEPGWTGFSSALQKSGNIEAIKTQNLTVSSQLDGQAQITEATPNEWKVTLPLQVVYQNDKEKVTQLLNVNVTIGRKVSGDLGITQMVATPRVAVGTQPNNTNTGSPTTPGATDSTTDAQTPTQNSDTSTPAATTTPSNSGTQPTPIDNGSNQQNQNTGTTNTPASPN